MRVRHRVYYSFTNVGEGRNINDFAGITGKGVFHTALYGVEVHVRQQSLYLIVSRACNNIKVIRWLTHYAV